MNKPLNNKQWADDVFSAQDVAWEQLEEMELPEVFLYTLAPKLAAKRRGIKDRAMIKAMKKHAIEHVRDDISREIYPDDCVEFHFVLAYLDAHVEARIIEDLESDKIMDYINDNYDLFPEDYY